MSEAGIKVARGIIQGSTRPTLPLVFVKDDGAPVPITTATFAGKLRKQGTATSWVLTGSVSITDGPLGKATLSYAAGDVAVFGMILVQVTATISGQPYIAQFYQPIKEAI